MIKRVGIIGSGNVAYHLWRGFKGSNELQSVNIWSPSIHEKAAFKEANITPISYMENDDIVIIATSDRVIQEVQKDIPRGPIIVHTSGFTSIEVLDQHEKTGVFYPLQTFSAQRPVDWKEVPLFIQSNAVGIVSELKQLAMQLTKIVQVIDEAQRKRLHIDGVFTNNFVNLMLSIVEKHCKENGVDKSTFYPLLEETVRKFQSMDAEKAQTGPAIRNDDLTINGHLDLLDAADQELYRLLTQQIQERFQS